MPRRAAAASSVDDGKEMLLFGSSELRLFADGRRHSLAIGLAIDADRLVALPAGHHGHADITEVFMVAGFVQVFD